MEHGTWIIFEGTGGEIDREFVSDKFDLTSELRALIKAKSWIIAPGDTFRFVEGESEIA